MRDSHAIIFSVAYARLRLTMDKNMPWCIWYKILLLVIRMSKVFPSSEAHPVSSVMRKVTRFLFRMKFHIMACWRVVLFFLNQESHKLSLEYAQPLLVKSSEHSYRFARMTL